MFAREVALRDRRGVALDSHKFIGINRAIETADYATLLGNAFDYATYAFAGKPVFQVPNPAAVAYPFPEAKDFAAARRRFLWIGSQGFVHKGLDLVLEAFARMPELPSDGLRPARRGAGLRRRLPPRALRDPEHRDPRLGRHRQPGLRRPARAHASRSSTPRPPRPAAAPSSTACRPG